MIAGGIGRHEVLLQNNQNYNKNLRKILDIGSTFSWKQKQQLTQRNARQQRVTRSSCLQRHDVLTVPLTVLLHRPITNMTHALSYQCSIRAGDIQSRSRILL